MNRKDLLEVDPYAILNGLERVGSRYISKEESAYEMFKSPVVRFTAAEYESMLVVLEDLRVLEYFETKLEDLARRRPSLSTKVDVIMVAVEALREGVAEHKDDAP